MTTHGISIWKAFRFVLFELFAGISTVCILPPLRRLWWILFGAHIGSKTVILRSGVTNGYHYGLSRLHIGRECFLGNGVDLDVRGGIILEDEVTISNGVALVSHINVGYLHHPLQKAYPTKEARVILKKGCYIGTNAIILPGVTVGEYAVVGAGAVVTKNVPAKTVVAGVPAKVIQRIHI